MAIDRQNKPQTANSIQELQNDSYDRDFSVAVVEGLVYNERTGALDRMVQPGQELPTSGNNGSIVLSYDIDGNLSTITKTINTVSYVKTLTYTDGLVSGISEWVEV